MKLKFSFLQSTEEANSLFNCHILPGGKILSLSRMRADARSLMINWRRTYLNTERKGVPSSVLKKGSFSHRSEKQSQFLTDQTKQKRLHIKISVFPRCGLTVPVLRLQSQASESARSCLIGPSHDWLSCRNIHCRERKLQREFLETGLRVQGVYLGAIKYAIFQCTFFRAVYTSISTCMTNRSEDWISCSITSAL